MSIEDMKNVDVRTVDSDSLVDINEIDIDDSLSPKERAAEFIEACKDITSGYTLSLYVEDYMIKKLVLYLS